MKYGDIYGIDIGMLRVSLNNLLILLACFQLNTHERETVHKLCWALKIPHNILSLSCVQRFLKAYLVTKVSLL